MDNKNFFRALFWALLAFLLWSMIAQRIWPPKHTPPQQTAQQSGGDADSNGMSGTSGVADTTSSSVADNADALSDMSDASDKLPADWSIQEAAEDSVVTLGETEGFDKSPYRLKLWASNVGASVETVRLSDHQQNVHTDDRYRLLTPVENSGRIWRSFALERVILDGSKRIDLHHKRWTASEVSSTGDGQQVTFSTAILDGETRVLSIERSYVIKPQAFDSGRHDVELTTTVRNLTDTAHTVQLVELGALGITREGRFQQDQTTFAAISESSVAELEVGTFVDVAKKGGLDLYPREEGDTSPLAWFGAGNLYFSATQCPVDAAGKMIPNQVVSVKAIDFDQNNKTTDDVTLRTVTPVISLSPGTEQTRRVALYLGPKDRHAFESADNPDYVARDYMVQIKHGYGSCAINFLTDMMIGLLNWLESVLGNFGVAIIIMVIVVRTILHPITKKTQVNMVRTQQRMSKLHPKVAELKKRYGNDAMKLNQETMKLYREEGVNPMSQGASCLPMMLQMPIWIALYTSLRNNVAMRCHGFVFWINDLTAPDAIHTFATPIKIPLVGWTVSEVNLLPFFVGFMMFAQQKLMPKPKHDVAVDSPQAQQAEQMQKMMPYMSLLMIVFFYNLPSGLNLYIMTSSLIGALEQLYIRKQIAQQDLSAPAKPAMSPAGSRKGRGSSLMEWLQKKAEEAQKLPSNRDQGKKRK
ncbi:MAG: YidC/Oxa1 family insertase periplasmic-domain containing protein [Phycisphaerales bacterium]|nr:YidC/Oxa1 family insertase periplasmic-domain containing protein [Phycisphaerales bacterium]